VIARGVFHDEHRAASKHAWLGASRRGVLARDESELPTRTSAAYAALPGKFQVDRVAAGAAAEVAVPLTATTVTHVVRPHGRRGGCAWALTR
jgi:hypothetical protein